MIELFPFLSSENIQLVAKIPILILIGLYVIFSYILYTKIKSLSRVVYISSLNASGTLNAFALIYFILSLSLFLIALAIL